ncbi:MAG: bacterial proteasome activator family protein [Actinobacteria bacterium]|nr:bacterial proteasome activator family protein [Actinomycetota bacterium]
MTEPDGEEQNTPPEQERPVDEQEVLVVPGSKTEEAPDGEAIQHPAKVMRIGSMVKQLLDEVRSAPLDEASRNRMKEVYESSLKELGDVLSPDLKDELSRLSSPFDEHETPSDAELRIAHAQLVGWLEGLFHGIQAMLFAQQMQSRAQLDEMRRSLPPGAPGETGAGSYL